MSTEQSAWIRVPLIDRVILVPVRKLVLSLLSVVVVRLGYVSVALSSLFTSLPAMLLHALNQVNDMHFSRSPFEVGSSSVTPSFI
ncbi:MAG: hypothetical protein ACJ8MR_06965 [Povalibacter sp.]